MKSIDKLIYDELAGRRSVVLPEVGTLEVRRRKAKRISDEQIIPPHNVVVLSSEETEGAKNIASLVAADRGIALDEATAVYGSWLEGARRNDGVISIDGAGEARDGKFIASSELHAELNPEGEEAIFMPIREKRGGAVWVWIVIAGVVIALAVLCCLHCCDTGLTGIFDRFCSKTPVVETVVTETPAEPAVDSLAATNAAEAATNAPAATTARFHVIAGAFVIESNADNFVAKIKREHPELTPMKLPHPRLGYSMVSIWQADTEREARNKMNMYWDVNLELWVWEQE
jgi:hypothetical protein